MNSWTCYWCGEVIEDSENMNTVIEGHPGPHATILATFHRGVCYQEAADYGWGG